MNAKIQNSAQNAIVKNTIPFSSKINSELTELEQETILKNLNKFPYRGGITFIAKNRGVARSTIFASLKKYKNKDYLYIIKDFGERNLKKAGMVA